MDILVKFTRPGYSNFSLSFSVAPIIRAGGVPTCGAAEASEGFGTSTGLVGASDEMDTVDVERAWVVLGSRGVAVFATPVIESN